MSWTRWLWCAAGCACRSCDAIRGFRRAAEPPSQLPRQLDRLSRPAGLSSQYPAGPSPAPLSRGATRARPPVSSPVRFARRGIDEEDWRRVPGSRSGVVDTALGVRARRRARGRRRRASAERGSAGGEEAEGEEQPTAREAGTATTPASAASARSIPTPAPSSTSTRKRHATSASRSSRCSSCSCCGAGASRCSRTGRFTLERSVREPLRPRAWRSTTGSRTCSRSASTATTTSRSTRTASSTSRRGAPRASACR